MSGVETLGYCGITSGGGLLVALTLLVAARVGASRVGTASGIHIATECGPTAGGATSTVSGRSLGGQAVTSYHDTTGGGVATAGGVDIVGDDDDQLSDRPSNLCCPFLVKSCLQKGRPRLSVSKGM